MINKKKIFLFLKVIVSLSLIGYIISEIDWNEALKNFSKANYYLLFLVFLLSIVEQVVLTYKWNVLIRARGINVSLGRLFLINYIGGFLGLFLPSSVGTDIVRGYYLVKNNSEKSVSVSSVFVDRILSMFALLLFGVVFILIAGDTVSQYEINFYVPLFFIILLVLFYILQREQTAKFIKRILEKTRFKKITNFIVNFHLAVLEYKKHPKPLIISFLINMIVQVTRVLIYFVIALAFGFSIPIIYFFLYVPVIMIVLTIPISIGGLGVREATFIAFFTGIGLSINDAAVIAFTNTFVSTLNTSLGGLTYLFYKSPQKLKQNEVFMNEPNLEKSKHV